MNILHVTYYLRNRGWASENGLQMYIADFDVSMFCQ
jgi:hypothetical protein